MSRKQQAVAMSAEGKTLQEIAVSLSVSERTVRRYLSTPQHTIEQTFLENNSKVDKVVSKALNRGVSKYQLTGLLAQEASLELNAENIKLIHKTIDNSRKRIAYRGGQNISFIPTMFEHCNDAVETNKHFKEMCEDVCFFIEQHIESFLDNHYEDKSVVRNDVLDKIYTAIGAKGMHRVDRLFELVNNAEYVLINRRK